MRCVEGFFGFLRIAHASSTLLAAGCSGLPVKTEIVALPPLPPLATVAGADQLEARVFVRPLDDDQMAPLEGTIDSLGTPLYRVSFAPAVAEQLRAAIERELVAAGCTLVDESAADVVVEGRVGTHRAWNDTTPLYWDVHVEIASQLSVRSSSTGAVCAPRGFRSRHTERTYLYPSHDVVRAACGRVFEDFSQSLRAPGGIFRCIEEVRR
jgi:hypothetical protein